MKIQQLLPWFMILYVLAGCSAPAAVPEEIQTPPAISVMGVGVASAKPDIVDIQLGVETVADEPISAVRVNTQRMNAVMEVLDNRGIPTGNIQTTYYSMWVEEIYDEVGQPTGEKRFRVTNQVNVRLDDIAIVGELLQDAIGAGATNVVGITFGVADTTELKQTAIENAMMDARNKAESIGSALGIEIGEVRQVFEASIYSPPYPYYAEKVGLGGGGGAVPISEGQFSMTVQLQVEFLIK
jgi:uncharacterized protein YggE